MVHIGNRIYVFYVGYFSPQIKKRRRNFKRFSHWFCRLPMLKTRNKDRDFREQQLWDVISTKILWYKRVCVRLIYVSFFFDLALSWATLTEFWLKICRLSFVWKPGPVRSGLITEWERRRRLGESSRRIERMKYPLSISAR